MARTSVEIIINGTPVTNHDLDQRARLIVLFEQGTPDAARARARDELVDDVLKLAEAERLGVLADPPGIARAFGDIARRVNLSPERLGAELQRAGVDPDTLRYRLKAVLSWQNVIAARRSGVQEVDDGQILAELRSPDIAAQSTGVQDAPQNAGIVEYILMPILIFTSDGQDRSDDVARLRAEFGDCETGAERARALPDLSVRQAVRRLSPDLPPGLVERLQSMEVGQLTAPNVLEGGIEMIALCARTALQSAAARWQMAESAVRARTANQLERRVLRDLRRRAIIEYR